MMKSRRDRLVDEFAAELKGCLDKEDTPVEDHGNPALFGEHLTGTIRVGLLAEACQSFLMKDSSQALKMAAKIFVLWHRNKGDV